MIGHDDQRPSLGKLKTRHQIEITLGIQGCDDTIKESTTGAVLRLLPLIMLVTALIDRIKASQPKSMLQP